MRVDDFKYRGQAFTNQINLIYQHKLIDTTLNQFISSENNHLSSLDYFHFEFLDKSFYLNQTQPGKFQALILAKHTLKVIEFDFRETGS